MIIAVDGPAASGKGTIARALAAHYGLPHLDTGLLYRAVGLSVARAGGDPDDEAQALAACRFDESILGDAELRSETTGALASRVSIHPEVREALVRRQQDFAYQPCGAVLDGRDIGTIIAPDAQIKLYVTASAERRAERRMLELQQRGVPANFEALVADIRARDDRDMNRPVAPLKRAEGAALLDTSDLSIEAAVRQAIALVDAQVEGQQLH